MGLTLKTEPDAQVWTLALPASQEEQLLNQKSRWTASRLQLPQLFGPLMDHKAVNTLTPESIAVPDPKVKEAYRQALTKDKCSPDEVERKTQELESWWTKVHNAAQSILTTPPGQGSSSWKPVRS